MRTKKKKKTYSGAAFGSKHARAISVRPILSAVQYSRIAFNMGNLTMEC